MTNSAVIYFEKIPRTTFQAKMPVMRGKHPILIDKPELKKAKEIINERLSTYKPAEPITKACHLEIGFYFRPPQTREKQCAKNEYTSHTVKPDLDNLCKGFIDQLVKTGWLEKDQIIVSINASKHEYIGQEFVRIKLEEI